MPHQKSNSEVSNSCSQPEAPRAAEPVVILVDHKIRDLSVAALIARQLEDQGVVCHLEPLEAFRAVVPAYRPGMVVFNHLNAGHLAEWSWRLAALGVLTAVLPNEGLIYKEDDVTELLSGRFHQARTDYFFCWNEIHARAVQQQGGHKVGRVEVVGVPRFDFYFEPWSRCLPPAPSRDSNRPRILLCTNLALAEYEARPLDADQLLGQWAKYAPSLSDYRAAIESQVRSRRRVMAFIDKLLDHGRFDIVLRPHPREDHAFYRSWLDRLPAKRRVRIQFDPSSNISSLILDCDIEISCESCTTAIESWIARKPTISLVFDKHPMLYRPWEAEGNYECSDPDVLPDMIARHLASPDQAEKREVRQRFLEKWCASPDGSTSYRLARLMSEALRLKPVANWSKLNINDYRRAAKLRIMHQLGQCYQYDPFLPLKRALAPARYAGKQRNLAKSIKPRDVAAARANLNRSISGSLDAAQSYSRRLPMA